jgi:bifunctional aspartokinase / homoserine dehydrogenase 1
MAIAPILSVAVIGVGGVGGALVDQLLSQHDTLLESIGVDIRVCYVVRSSRMLAAPLIDSWRASLAESTAAPHFEQLLVALQSSAGAGIFCDCTASDDISALYAGCLRSGVHVVTANKRAASGPRELYAEIVAAARSSGKQFLCEANVGAGLPIISTVRDMVRTGDKFIEVSGCLSGTLSYIFSSFDGSEPFSTIVSRAKSLGYTEPDPRDDLSGADVARKVVILAREIGLDVELSDVPVQSLVPVALQSAEISAAEFMARLPEFDAELTAMSAEASSAGDLLRYVGHIDSATRTCSVELRRYSFTHPLGALRGSDNLVSIRTARYDAQPLIIRGPGAGNEVTAAGVFGDILHIAVGISSSLGMTVRA